MDDALRQRLEHFLRPLYQDLDGVSRFEDVERVARIARRLYSKDDRAFELLLLFHGLGKWLEKIGNLSRTTLTVGFTQEELSQISSSTRRLDAAELDADWRVSSAVLMHY